MKPVVRLGSLLLFMLAVCAGPVIADPIQVTFKGIVVAGGPVGSLVEGTAVFYNDLLVGNEGGWDWFRYCATLGRPVSFTINGEERSTPDAGASLSIATFPPDDYESFGYSYYHAGFTDLALRVRGDSDALIIGPNLDSHFPMFVHVDLTHTAPCAQEPEYGNWESCGVFDNGDTQEVFQLTEFGYDPIPEPTSLLLLGTGLMGVVGRAWRRRRG